MIGKGVGIFLRVGIYRLWRGIVGVFGDIDFLRVIIVGRVGNFIRVGI